MTTTKPRAAKARDTDRLTPGKSAAPEHTLPEQSAPEQSAPEQGDDEQPAPEQGDDEAEVAAMPAVDVVRLMLSIRADIADLIERFNEKRTNLERALALVQRDLMGRVRDDRITSPVRLEDCTVSLAIARDTKWSVSDVDALRAWVAETGYVTVLQGRISPKGLEAAQVELRDMVARGAIPEGADTIPGLSAYTQEILRVSTRSRQA